MFAPVKKMLVMTLVLCIINVAVYHHFLFYVILILKIIFIGIMHKKYYCLMFHNFKKFKKH